VKRGGSVHEECERLVANQVARLEPLPSAGSGEGRYDVHDLAFDAESLSAGRQYPQLGASPQKSCDQVGTRVGEVLAIVQKRA